jgi:hypothetical protein
MSVLGRAFINVHADLRPFRKDLERDLKIVTDVFEASINQALSRQLGQSTSVTGRRMGEQIGDGFNEGFRSRTSQRDNPAFIGLVASLASALDDGLSALPTEVKAALVAGLLAASPLVAGALSAAITAGIGVGVAGLGIALASQYETVQNQATSTFRNIRMMAVQSASAFEGATLTALQMIEGRLDAMSGRLTNIFTLAAELVPGFTDAVLDTLDILLAAVENVLTGAEPFVDELANSFRVLGVAVGYAMEILASTGEDGTRALRDMVSVFAAMVVGAAFVVKALTHVYGLIRDIAIAVNSLPPWVQVLSPPLAILGLFANATDQTALNARELGNANDELAVSTTGVVAKTDAEIKALRELANALEGAADATLDSIQSQVDFERSLDQVEEALKRNGRTLDINTEKGRQNVEAFIKGVRDAGEAARDRVATGELTQQQALVLYDNEIARLKEVARQAGITEAQFTQLFGQAIEFNRLAIAPDTSGLDAASFSAEQLAHWLRESIALAKHLSSTIAGGALAGARGFDNGGMVYLPETVNVAESGPELIVPMTKPARAAQLVRDSGLAALLGTGDTQVMVFIGDEQLEAKMVRVVQRNDSAQSRAMTHGSRRF